MEGLDPATLIFGDPSIEQRLAEVRSVRRAVVDLADEVVDAAAGLPSSVCTSWRSDASAGYATRLAELGTEVRRAHAALDDAGIGLERAIRALEAEKAAQAEQAAAGAAAAAAATIGPSIGLTQAQVHG
ncbi:hypothetical protein [Agromyces laixinhei]|uniref:hypothetical protein n=1 Tax=Agromyces laixinhei TaxID=2585717 RepID=UPI0012EE6335|nr:hypothetical protein [Agromyces laixinhei]